MHEHDLFAGKNFMDKILLAKKPLKYMLKDLQIPVRFGYDLVEDKFELMFAKRPFMELPEPEGRPAEKER